jgi:hypothetical protein
VNGICSFQLKEYICIPSSTRKTIYFRIADKNGHKIDFVLGDKNMSFSSSLGNIIFSNTFDVIKLRSRQWMKIRLNVNIKKESFFTCEANPYITYNPDQNSIAVADQHSFYSFSMNDRRLTKQVVGRGFSYPRYANQMIYNPADSNYYCYNLVKEGDGRELAAFDPAPGTWAATTPHDHYSDYWHHNRYFSVRHNTLYLFGGYGHHKYNRDVFMYDASENSWSKKVLTGRRH